MTDWSEFLKEHPELVTFADNYGHLTDQMEAEGYEPAEVEAARKGESLFVTSAVFTEAAAVEMIATWAHVTLGRCSWCLWRFAPILEGMMGLLAEQLIGDDDG